MKFMRHYFDFSNEPVHLALQAGILSLICSYLHVILNPAHDYWLLIVMGIFIIALILVLGIKESPIRRLKYAATISIINGVVTSLGCLIHDSYIFSVISIIFFMILIGLSSGTDNLTAGSVLFIANTFVIGNGLEASSTRDIILNGVALSAGGLALTLWGTIHYFLTKNIYDYPHFVSRYFKWSKVFKVSKKNWLYAIKLIITVVTAYTIAYCWRLPEGFWAPMTALLIVKADHDFSRNRISHRLFGTLFGCVISLILILCISTKLVLASLMLPVLFLTIVALARHYGSYVFFLTIMVTIMYNLMRPTGYIIVEDRFIATIIAISTVFTILKLINLFEQRNLFAKANKEKQI